MSERVGVWSDPETKRRLRLLSAVWGLTIQDTLRRVVQTAWEAEAEAALVFGEAGRQRAS